MDIFLRPKNTQTWFRFPLMPDRINAKTAATVISLNVIKIGEIKIPRGNQLTGYSWNGVFPGEHMANASFVFDWKPPAEIVKIMKDWEVAGTTLDFMVTELSINEDVFIESFQYEYSGTGDCSYTLSLALRKTLTVSTMPSPPPKSPGVGGGSGQTATIKKKCKYYDKPSTKGKKLGKLAKGTSINLLEKSGKWWKFSSSAITQGSAWVKKTYVK